MSNRLIITLSLLLLLLLHIQTLTISSRYILHILLRRKRCGIVQKYFQRIIHASKLYGRKFLRCNLPSTNHAHDWSREKRWSRVGRAVKERHMIYYVNCCVNGKWSIVHVHRNRKAFKFEKWRFEYRATMLIVSQYTITIHSTILCIASDLTQSSRNDFAVIIVYCLKCIWRLVHQAKMVVRCYS